MANIEELTYEKLMNELNGLQEKHEIIKISYIGESVFSRKIPIITLGEESAQKGVLYVSTHHANENVCTSVLLKFVKDYLEAYERYAQIYQINMRYLYKMRKIYIVPMLNPDGVEYRLCGIDEKNPIKERVVAYNGDYNFSNWCANARGVDLNHNYDAYFEEYKEIERQEGITNGKTRYSGEYAESEPEISAIVNFIRYNIEKIEGVLSLHTQGEEIYYDSHEKIPSSSEHIAGVISKMTGYKKSKAQGLSSYGGLTDWFIKEFNKPSFTVECGIGKNPLPTSSIMEIYTRLKELLFTFPILF